MFGLVEDIVGGEEDMFEFVGDGPLEVDGPASDEEDRGFNN